MENVTIKVEPQILKSISMDVVASIEKTESAFREIDNIIERSGSYWNGNGHTGMQRVYAGKRDDYKKICKMLREHIQSLQQIAGVYEQTEQIASQVAASLEADVII